MKKASLDKKSIQAIADQVENRLSADNRENGRKKTSSTSGQPAAKGRSGGFLWGALSGVAVAAAFPLLGTRLRPAVREVIKGGIVTGRYLQRTAEGVKEDFQDMTAEARADLETKEDSTPEA